MEFNGLLKGVEGLAMADFFCFYELSQLLSVREVARRKGQNPSRVSRSLSQLERALDKKLMVRTPSGLTLTEEGRNLQAVIHRMLEAAEGLGSRPVGDQLTLGSNSFLSNRLIALCMGRLETKFSDIRVIDFPPDELVSSGIRGAFNVALHLGPRDWPQSWISRRIGEISWILCARKDHPLSKKKKLGLDDLLPFPFVFPMYWGKNGIVLGNDHFPLSIFKRKRGFGTSTAEAGALMLINTDQLGFLPDVTVEAEVQAGRLCVLGRDQFRAPQPLYLSAHTEHITQKKFDFLDEEFSGFLKTVRSGRG